eukprot:31053-Amphidinium_carterae.1
MDVESLVESDDLPEFNETIDEYELALREWSETRKTTTSTPAATSSAAASSSSAASQPQSVCQIQVPPQGRDMAEPLECRAQGTSSPQ